MKSCPALQKLEDFLEEQLGDAESKALSLHIDGCSRCQQALESLTQDSPTLSGHAGLSAVSRASSPQVSVGSAAAFLSSLKVHSPFSSAAPAGPREHPAPASGQAEEEAAARLVIDGYEILEEIGRGGMGVVYKARQVGLNRLVALKMVLAGLQAGSKELARFRHEAEAVARLRHPNIIPIFDIGEAQGRPYFVLELMEEGSLAARLHGDPQPLAAAARLLETLARAVHFAHQHHVVHRDLKPANILLQRQAPNQDGEPTEAVPPFYSYTPKITDFGLAKRLDEQSSRTQTGEVVGTPSYMAPEQAGGRTTGVGPAGDVYSLGAVLYEMLTGRPPFKGASALDTVLQVLHEEPVRPSSLRPGLPRDLETICLKCLQKEPQRRYPSALALADDLQRFRHGKPITARPVGLLERAAKWARHRPLPAALVAGMILVTLLGFLGVTWQWRVALAEKHEKEEQRQQAEQARSEAEEARIKEIDQRNHARRSLYYSRIAQAQLQWRVHDYTSAVGTLDRCRPSAGQEDRRGWEWYYLQGLFHTALLTCRHGMTGAGGAVTYSPDGRRIASVVAGQPTDGPARRSEVCVWDALTGEPLFRQEAANAYHRLAFTPDGKYLALATTDGALVRWETGTGREARRDVHHEQMIGALSFSHDGRLLASASWDQTIKVADTGSGKVLHVLRGHKARVQSVAFHPDGRQLAAGSWDGVVKVWDAQTGQEIWSERAHKNAVYCVAYSPDGQLLVSAGNNGNLKLWDVRTQRAVQTLSGHTGAVLSAAFSPDGRYLAYGGGDATVRVYDVESGVERIAFRGHTAPVESISFSPDGSRLVSCSPAGGEVKVWDLTRHPEYATFADTGSDIEALSFAAEGRNLVSVTQTGKLHTWDAGSGVLLQERQLEMNTSALTPAVPVVFASGGRRLAARARDDGRLIKCWATDDGKEQIVFRGHTLPVYCLHFSGDGRLLASAGCAVDREQRAHEVMVWDAHTGALLATHRGAGRLFNLQFCPNGRRLALGGEGGVVTLLTWQSGAKVSFSEETSDITALAFSPDGRFLAGGGVEDRRVRIWQLDGTGSGPVAGNPSRVLAAPSFLCDLVFSPDGQRLAGISRDLVKVWDVDAGQEVLTLRGGPQRHWDPPFNPRVLFSPDGTRLAGTNWDESISLWDADPEADSDSQAFKARRRQAADARALFWHLQEAQRCLNHENRTAATFHLQRLQDVPLPGPLQERRTRLLAWSKATSSAGK